MKSNQKRLIEKSIASAISAIEIYNKPNFLYREETFAILMVNAWELLLKAKIITHHGMKAVYLMEYKERIDGTKYKNPSIVTTGSGNPKTIGIFKSLVVIENKLKIKLDPVLKENLYLLLEIRDTATHFSNNDKNLNKKILEIGTATLRNFLVLIQEWFDIDLSTYNFYLMPLSFYNEHDVVTGISTIRSSKATDSILRYIDAKEKSNTNSPNDKFNITLNIETKFTKSTKVSSLLMNKTNDPKATHYYVKEEDITEIYCWDYKELNKRLNERYSDFKSNPKYHSVRKKLMVNADLCKTRYLDPKNKIGTKKDWYNPNILKEFDKNYTLKDIKT